MRKKFAFLSTVIVAAFMSTGAQAAQFLQITGPSGNYGDNEVTCSAGDTAPCSFTRSFNFVTPIGFNNVSVDLSSILSAGNLNTDINFTSATLNGVNFDFVATGRQEIRNLFDQPLLFGANNVINLAGTVGGAGFSPANASFGGNLSFASVAAVPEPAAWMLMLIGMAGVGYSMRRKDKTTLRVRYT